MALAGEVELRNRAFCFTRKQRLVALAAILLPLALLVAVVVFALASLGGGADEQSLGALADEFWPKLWQELSKNAAQLVGIGLTTLISAAALLRGPRERLFVGPGGIRYFSGMPRWLGTLGGDWSASADQIRDIRAAHFALAPAPNLIQLVVETTAKTRRLAVFTYVDANDYEPKKFGVLTRLRTNWSDVAELFASMPLVEYAQSAGYELEPPDPPKLDGKMELSLKDKPRVGVAGILLFVGISYAVIDMGIISETYAAGTPIGLIVLSGFGVGALAWPLLGRDEVSRPVRAGIAVLLALTAMGALYPGLIRINRIGAPDPAPHAYRHNEAGALEPVEATSPELDLPHLVELLTGSQPGDVHELWIRQGSLGFHQIDIDALHDRIEELER